ncbi:MAG TPA: pilus assembly PilX N-terminal domain-containing protein [Nitrospiria bacterium]|nr:pilus assembly PilX N-terminal domain-containing protein [Nitrospiria bacterium]
MWRLILIKDEERGAILLVTMMILLVLTVMGIAAISTTTSELQITGNAKVQNMVFYGADGGSRTYVPILKSIIDNRAIPAAPLGTPVQDSNLLNELLGLNVSPPNDGGSDSPTNHPDLSLTAGNITVGVDIDRVQERFLSGGASEFAGGYEGIGASSSSGGIGIYYAMDSVGQIGPSESQVSHVYIYHVE